MTLQINYYNLHDRLYFMEYAKKNIIRGKFVFELITKKENLFLGFTKGKDIKFQLEDKIEGINFILLGLKYSYFGERKMDQFLDWKTIQDLDNLKKDLNNRFETFDNKFLNVLN